MKKLIYILLLGAILALFVQPTYGQKKWKPTKPKTGTGTGTGSGTGTGGGTGTGTNTGGSTSTSTTTYLNGPGISISGTGTQKIITNIGDLSNNNELQELSINGNQLSISNGNMVNLPIAQSQNFLNADFISTNGNRNHTLNDDGFVIQGNTTVLRMNNPAADVFQRNEAGVKSGLSLSYGSAILTNQNGSRGNLNRFGIESGQLVHNNGANNEGKVLVADNQGVLMYTHFLKKRFLYIGDSTTISNQYDLNMSTTSPTHPDNITSTDASNIRRLSYQDTDVYINGLKAVADITLSILDDSSSALPRTAIPTYWIGSNNILYSSRGILTLEIHTHKNP